ncbi:MAG: hypothetical protein NUV82_04440, partial [Candidatus Komeilibacteria bacterium]|nr:hypothetical protein [Candidatus Komeilibacteria bacterium]
MSTNKKRLFELIEKFPIIHDIREGWRYSAESSRYKRVPVTDVIVLRADESFMYRQEHDIKIDGGSYLIRDGMERGTRETYLMAVDINHTEIARLKWSVNPFETYAKDVFGAIDPEAVKYLLWVEVNDWHNGPADENKGLFGTLIRRELYITIYQQHSEMTFTTLIGSAEQNYYRERNAYKRLPAVMSDLPGLERALKEGGRLHAFRSGGGLRVVRIDRKDKCIGYGEHPHVEEALIHANSDYLAGQREYEDTYGVLYTHYLTGDSKATNILDAWILQGHTFDCWMDSDLISFQLRGAVQVQIPEWAKELTKKRPGRPVRWYCRGIIYQTIYDKVFPNGSYGYSTKVIKQNKNKKTDPWNYNVI